MVDQHKAVALEKIKKFGNPYAQPYPLWHITTLDRLKDILTLGLISANYAKNIGKTDFRRNFDSSWNNDAISLMSNTSSRETTAPDIAILVNPKIKSEEPQEIDLEKDTNRPAPKEVLVKDIIKQEEFVGLVIGEVGYDFKLEKPVEPHPLDVKQVIEVIKNIDPESSLPIYFKGKLVWPN